MAKESIQTELDRLYDLKDRAAGMGLSMDDYQEWLEKRVKYERERDLKFFAARSEIRDGYSERLDLDNVDIEKVREDLGIPRGHEGTTFIKSEVKRLKQITHQPESPATE
jgi:hypothetical protein